ncbi:MAG: glycosyltransferase [Solirubrobacterales bacterium]|nr:glycosyltransferase [Solirubrobacterales bacterium]
MTVVVIVFWVAAGLLVYTQVGYGLLLALLAGIGRRARANHPAARTAAAGQTGANASAAGSTATLPPALTAAARAAQTPSVTAIIAAYNEQEVIAPRVANLRNLDYDPARLQVIVASDGSTDATVDRARQAGADLVLALERGGKIRAQDAAVAAADGELLVFSDANAVWEPDALRRLVQAFQSDQRIGYVCGDVTFTAADADGDEPGPTANQEGLYWRYEMWLRRMESGLSSVTAGNGAIYATRRESYLNVDPLAGHDLSFPFNMVKRGWRAVYVPDARAREKLAPTIEGEFARKRRMARRTWPTIFSGGLLSPRGYSPLYALMIFSHRILRYLVPFLHVIALAASIALIAHGWVYILATALQVALLAGAALAPLVPARPLLVARYYVVTNWALAAGLWDWLRGERSPVWETVEGTR